MSKIINRCLLLIASIMFWVSGIVMLSDISKDVKDGDELLKANIFPYSLEKVVTECLESFNATSVFVIVIMSVMMLLTLFLIVDLFFDINSLFAKITKIGIILVLILISIMFLTVYLNGVEVTEKLSIIDTDISDLLALSLVIISMSSSYTTILTILLFGTVCLLFAAVIDDNKVVEIVDKKENKEEVVDEVEQTYQNAIKRKIAETEEKLKTKELEKELEEKINKLKELE